MSLFQELKRRNVFRVGIAYGVAAWLLIQIADTVFPRIGLSDSAVTLVIALLAIGFIPALIFAWAFEMTPEGLRREKDIDRAQSVTPRTGKRLDRVIILGLVAVIVILGMERFRIAGRDQVEHTRAAPAPAGEPETAGPAGDRKSVAVLPFNAMSSGEDDEYFADGLTEEILNSLTALPELLVTARTSSFHFKGQNLPVPEIASKLGVDHVVEGSMRRAGERVRITAQLIRAEDGFHLWSQTYDRTLEDIFAVQEDIATSIAETLDVVLNEEKRNEMRQAGIGNVEAFIAYQKGMDAYDRAHRVENPTAVLVEANRWLNEALAIVPDIDQALYLRTDLYGHVIFDHATNRHVHSQGELESAVAEIRSSLGKAIRVARNEQLRAMIEVELAMFSDDWSQTGRKLDLAFGLGYCNPANWIAEFALPHGKAAQIAAHQEERSRCDPMSGWPVVAGVSAMIWNSDAERGLGTAERFLERAGFHPWVDDLRFTALLASGRWTDDPGVFDATPEGSNYGVPRAVYSHSINNDTEKARAIYNEWAASNRVDDVDKLNAEAVMGNHEAANRLAAAMDSRFGGSLALSVAVANCRCGAPFDLDATPNFKARIEQAGFAWPPTTPIQYPAKDW